MSSNGHTYWRPTQELTGKYDARRTTFPWLTRASLWASAVRKPLKRIDEGWKSRVTWTRRVVLPVFLQQDFWKDHLLHDNVKFWACLEHALIKCHYLCLKRSVGVQKYLDSCIHKRLPGEKNSLSLFKNGQGGHWRSLSVGLVYFL